MSGSCLIKKCRLHFSRSVYEENSRAHLSAECNVVPIFCDKFSFYSLSREHSQSQHCEVGNLYRSLESTRVSRITGHQFSVFYVRVCVLYRSSFRAELFMPFRHCYHFFRRFSWASTLLSQRVINRRYFYENLFSCYWFAAFCFFHFTSQRFIPFDWHPIETQGFVLENVWQKSRNFMTKFWISKKS